MTPEAKRILERQRYTARKLAGLCINCGAGLQEDDGLRCVECTERKRLIARRYRASDQRGARKAAAAEKARRLARRRAGLCMFCSTPAAPDRAMCPGHLVKHRRACERRVALKRAGVVSIQTRQSLALRQRVDTTEQRLSERISLLSALANADSPTLSQLLERTRTEQSARNARTVLLGKLVKHGLVERRGAWRHASEYQITTAGRAELARLTARRAA